jgi:hypothetical protein
MNRQTEQASMTPNSERQVATVRSALDEVET